MTLLKRFAMATLLSGALWAQPCPRVTPSTNQTTTIHNLVASVNCLVAAKGSQASESVPGSGLQVDAIQIIGPQHTRSYKKVTLALLAVPTGSGTRTALVTPESADATVSATAGAECHVKINKDNSVDAQCNLTGGTLYVVYHN